MKKSETQKPEPQRTARSHPNQTQTSDLTAAKQKAAKSGSASSPSANSLQNKKKAETETKKLSKKEKKSLEKRLRIDKNGINREILTFVYVFLFVFAAFIGYFAWFQTTQSETVVNNSYNKRVEAMVEKTVRGKILSSDGTVLAETVTESDGSEERYYPYGEKLAHVTGYVDEGKTAVESIANYYLLSSHQNVITKFINDLTGDKNKGDDVVTTIDLDLQLAAYEAMAGRKGAAVVLQASTGKILAMVSNPSYDPNIIEEQWADLIAETNKEANLVNRVTQGLYPPGSTFKLVTLLEFIRQYPDTWQDFTYDCQGVNAGEGYSMRCYGGTAHGHLTLQDALVTSCNGAFAAIGQMLDRDQWNTTCQSLLFGSKLSLALPNKASSFTLTSDMTTWAVAQTAIGQGQTQITPLLSAMITAAIANDGIMMQPYILDRVISGDKVVEQYEAVTLGTVMTTEETAIIRQMMRAVITDGTTASLQTDLYEAYGKTGTAEYITGSDSTHAWFTGFAGEGEDCIVVAVVLEGAGTGSQQAAPVAAAVFGEYFSR